MSLEPKTLDEYRDYVKKRLAALTPLLQKAAMGDFTSEIEIPEKEDEFTELLVGLSLMMDDLRQLKEMQEIIEDERKKRLEELEQWRKLIVGRETRMIDLKKQIFDLKQEIEKLNKK